MHVRYKFEGRLVFAMVQSITIDEAKCSVILEFYDGQLMEMQGTLDAIAGVKEDLVQGRVVILDDMEVVK